ncbi:MAG: PadR family transcriptional regulator [Prochlorothrix sp.]|nr:helix-turn-helix transcriptional regulator [Prochlorothrix sp.]
MNWNRIYQFFDDPPPKYLPKELAVAYVLSLLLEGETAGVEMIERLEQQGSPYRISEHILRIALDFLLAENAITRRWDSSHGRGRPRRLYCLTATGIPLAQDLAQRWRQYGRESGH